MLAGCSLMLASLAGFAGEREYRISSELWIDGELRGSPSLIMQAGVQGSIETAGEESGWRLVFDIEEPEPHERAAEGALWVYIEIHEKQDGEWDHLTDSMLGIPPGRTGTLSIVDQGQDEPTRETARLYMTVQVEPLGN